MQEGGSLTFPGTPAYTKGHFLLSHRHKAVVTTIWRCVFSLKFGSQTNEQNQTRITDVFLKDLGTFIDFLEDHGLGDGDIPRDYT